MSNYIYNYHQLPLQQQATLYSLESNKLNSNQKDFKKGPFKFQKIKAYANMPFYQKAGSQWNDQQILKFAIFVVVFYSSLQIMEKQNTQKWTVFKKMSRFIKSRNPNQCRSYYIKVLSKFSTLGMAILFYEANIKDLGYRIQRSKFQLQRIEEQQPNQSNLSPINIFISKRESIKSQNIILSEPKYMQKCQKQVMQPTASSYDNQQNLQTQNPVNNNYTNQNSFPSKNIYSFSKSNIKKQRQPIQSFESFQEQEDLEDNYYNKSAQKQIKIEQKNSLIGLNVCNQAIQQQFLKPSMNIQNFISSFSSKISHSSQKQQSDSNFINYKNISPDQIIQKRRQAFLQCHKYFLLWINQLWKIMEQFPQQSQKNLWK